MTPGTRSGVGGPPVLLACSHGTRSRAGQAAVSALVSAVADAVGPAVEVRQAFVDVEQPDVATALAELRGRRVRVVPLLLAAGHHVHVDLAGAVRDAGGRAAAGRIGGSPAPTLAAALGPDPVLVEVLADRVAESGVRPDDTVLLVSAGSTDPGAVADCRTVAEGLAARLGRPVTAAFLSAAHPSLSDALAGARADGTGRVAVVSHLLAPGYFADRLARSGADLVTVPLLDIHRPPDPRLVDLVVRRHREG